MDWTFVYLMVVLKLPILGLFWIVWWAVKSEVEVEAEVVVDADDDTTDGEGGSKLPRQPLGPRPRSRGPHGGQPRPLPPPRARPVSARGKHVAQRRRTSSP